MYDVVWVFQEGANVALIGGHSIAPSWKTGRDQQQKPRQTTVQKQQSAGV
jgi:hypothetical protein